MGVGSHSLTAARDGASFWANGLRDSQPPRVGSLSRVRDVSVPAVTAPWIAGRERATSSSRYAWARLCRTARRSTTPTRVIERHPDAGGVCVADPGGEHRHGAPDVASPRPALTSRAAVSGGRAVSATSSAYRARGPGSHGCHELMDACSGAGRTRADLLPVSGRR
jgi:hypothetical protein